MQIERDRFGDPFIKATLPAEFSQAKKLAEAHGFGLFRPEEGVHELSDDGETRLYLFDPNETFDMSDLTEGEEFDTEITEPTVL